MASPTLIQQKIRLRIPWAAATWPACRSMHEAVPVNISMQPSDESDSGYVSSLTFAGRSRWGFPRRYQDGQVQMSPAGHPNRQGIRLCSHLPVLAAPTSAPCELGRKCRGHFLPTGNFRCWPQGGDAAAYQLHTRRMITSSTTIASHSSPASGRPALGLTLP